MSDTIRININPASNIPYELTPDQLLNVGINPALFRGEPGTSGKSPYIGEDNYWYEYDDEAQQWVKTDVYADEAAAEVALAAAQRADSAAQVTEAAIESANAAAESATQTAEDAKTRTDEALAQAQRTLDSAVSSAEESVQKAVADAESAASTATSAASEATTQAAAAEQAASDANTAIDDAQSAAQAATDATQKALDAADRANQAASGLGLQKEVLDHVPEPSEMVENVIYLVPAEEPNPENVYNEYMLIDGQRELIGSTATNLTDYVKSDELNSTLENYAEKPDLETKADLIEGKVDPAQLPDHLIVGHEGELPPVELGINADTLQGHNADYFAPKDALDNKSDKVEIIELSIPNNGWESADDELYRVVIENENIHAKDVHIADLKQSGDEVSDKTAREAWAKITRITAAEGSATVYASESLESVITMELATWADAVNKGGAVESEVFIVRRGIVGGGRSAISIESAVVTLDTDSWTYDKTEHCPKVISVMFEGIPLTENRDYVVMSVPQTNAGNYNVHVLGILAYDGVANAPWRIDKAQGTISVEPQSVQITGAIGTSTTVQLTYEGDGEITLGESEYVTLSREGNVVTVTSKQEGSGSVAITLEDGQNYKGMSVELQVTVQFRAPVSDTLEENDWATIAGVAASGEAQEFWQIGDEKEITINDKTYHAQIIGFDHDDLDSSDAKYSDSSYNGGKKKAAITFQMKECLTQNYRMDETSDNSCSWRDSEMRVTTMPKIKEQFDQAAVAVMRTVTKSTAHSQTDSTIYKTADVLFLLCHTEVFETQGNSHPGEGTQYAFYLAGNSKIKKYLSGSAAWWWLRSPSTGNSYAFRVVDTGGTTSNSSATDTSGSVAAGFCV